MFVGIKSIRYISIKLSNYSLEFFNTCPIHLITMTFLQFETIKVSKSTKVGNRFTLSSRKTLVHVMSSVDRYPKF